VSVSTNLLGSIPAVIGGSEDIIEGTDTGETILGTDADDVINALGGDDFVQALAGNDQIDAGDGNDTVLGGDGDDTVEGGAGDDVVRGDAGADTFLFDPSQQGADTVVDFSQEDGDVIALSAAGLANVGLEEFSGAALDESDAFDIVANDDGDVEIQHPGGTITLNGVPFAAEGQEAPTFAALEAAGLLEIQGLVQGTDAGEQLTGTDGDDVINALGGDDTITALSGDDIISTGEGRDTVNIDPSNANEGADTITDFSAPNELDPSVGDSINFELAKLLEADSELPAADGDAGSLSLADFDASANWTLGASEAGDVLFTHPGGSVEFSNIAFGNQQFADLGAVIKVDGAEIPADGIAVEPPANGEELASGDQAADGGDVTSVDGTTDGEQPVSEPVQTEEGAIA
jgi:Ca2+-binding RTX toxin-like protein